MRVRLIVSGVWTVHGVSDGQNDVLQEMEELQSARGSDVNGLIKLLMDIAEGTRDPRRLPVELSHRVDDDHQIWQFTKGRLRLLWFYHELRLIVCTSVFMKNSRKTPPKEISTAIARKRRYEDAASVGSLEVIEDEDR